MDIAFKGLVGKSVVEYMDDVIMCSNKITDHPHHLKYISEICRKYGIYLNQKKSVFSIVEGKLLGHIISKDVISMYLE
jgi:hypothetical protein